jgi:hypothetical protein
MDPNQQVPVTNNGMGQPYPPASAQPYSPVQPTGLPRPDAVYAAPMPHAVPSVQQQQYGSPQPQASIPQAYAAQPQPVVPGTVAPHAAMPQKTNPNSTQNMLQIAEVRDGIVIMNDGSFRSVVMVKSINFDLMSPQEQESVEYAYQGFLNSLYFPIQIFIRSQRIDLQPYIEKLDRIRTEHDNMLLALLMDDYVGYIEQLAQQTNLMDKRFYLVIPYFPVIDPQKAITQSKNFFTGFAQLFNTREDHVVINEQDLEKAKNELRNRVQAVLGGLMQCGIQGLPLDTQELIELYYDSYNPDTATRQQLKNFNDLTADIVVKGQGTASQPHLQRELQ